MKLLIGKNHTGLYDSLFKMQGNQITKVQRKFDDYVCQFDEVDLMEIRLPLEIVDRILLFTFQSLLAAFHFEEAFYISCTSPHTIELIYYFIYGSAPGIEWWTKKNRVSRTLFLMQEIYDNYITCQAMFDNPTIVLEWETTQYARSQMRTLFAPWDMHSATTIGTYGDIGPPDAYTMAIGPFYGDLVTLTRYTRKECFIEADELAHPMVPILVLNQLKACSTWTNSTTNYLFSRFAMLLKFCFGPVYYYVQKKRTQRMATADSDSDDAFFIYNYVFHESLNCVRK